MKKRKSTKDFKIVSLPHLIQNFSLNELPPTTNEMLAMNRRGFKRRSLRSEYDSTKITWSGKIGLIIERQNLILFREPTWVHLRFFVGNQIDRDNLYGCQKWLLDGMVDAGLIVDDSDRWLKDTTFKREKPIKGVDIKLIVSVSNRQIMKDLEPILYQGE